MSKIISDNAFVLAGKIYSASIGIILLPFFLEVLGKEQFGLVGSFVIVQACMQILDAGMSGVLTRQSILTQRNYASFKEFVRVLKYCLVFFCFVATLIGFLGHTLAMNYGTFWFNSKLNSDLINSSVSLMFIIFSVRYVQGPIKSILVSFEKHKSLAIFDVVYVSLNGPVTLAYLYLSEGNIKDYFLVQLVVALLCFVSMSVYTWRVIDRIINKLRNQRPQGEFVPTRIFGLLKFGFQLSSLSMLWVLVNQSDKLTLTKYMELSEYSFYAISISLLGVISIFVSTMIQTVRPRLVCHFSRKELEEFTFLFKNSVILSISFLFPLVIFLSYYGEDLLYIWTQNNELATKVMKYLPQLLIATFFAALSEFAFMILYSTGNLKAHTVFYSLVSVVIIPLNIYIAATYLGDGSSKFFLIFNCLIFATWSLHNIRKNISETGRFFCVSILLTALISVVFIYFANLLIVEVTLESLAFIVALGLTSVATSYLLLKTFVQNLNINFKESGKV
jgi:O-antigen/teichoic acid export membrane protein